MRKLLFIFSTAIISLSGQNGFAVNFCEPLVATAQRASTEAYYRSQSLPHLKRFGEVTGQWQPFIKMNASIRQLVDSANQMLSVVRTGNCVRHACVSLNSARQQAAQQLNILSHQLPQTISYGFASGDWRPYLTVRIQSGQTSAFFNSVTRAAASVSCL